jgi:hypothetical protein
MSFSQESFQMIDGLMQLLMNQKNAKHTFADCLFELLALMREVSTYTQPTTHTTRLSTVYLRAARREQLARLLACLS